MTAQTPFDQSKARFEIHRVTKGDVHFAGAYWLTDPEAEPIDMDNPIAITCIGGPAEMLPEGMTDPHLLRAHFEWLVRGCAAFHKVAVHNYLDDPNTPQITPARA